MGGNVEDLLNNGKSFDESVLAESGSYAQYDSGIKVGQTPIPIEPHNSADLNIGFRLARIP